MPLSVYEITVPVFISKLKTLSNLLTKGSTTFASKEDQLLSSRLVEDMAALPFQIQRVSDIAKGVAVRLAKVQPVPMADKEKTFPELQERIEKTIKVLETVTPESMEAIEDQAVELKSGDGSVRRFETGKDYALKYAIPNFYFHVMIAYALLRKEGVKIGKDDFMDWNN